MVYALITKYTDGHTATQFIDCKAPAASKTDCCVTRFIQGNVLYICYPAEYHPERKFKFLEEAVIKIHLDGVQTVTLHNVDGDTIDPVSPFRSGYPLR